MQGGWTVFDRYPLWATRVLSLDNKGYDRVYAFHVYIIMLSKQTWYIFEYIHIIYYRYRYRYGYRCLLPSPLQFSLNNLHSLLLNPYCWFRRGWIPRSDWIRLNFNLLQWGLEPQPLKIDPWKRRFLFETTIFWGYVGFREGIQNNNW